MDQDRPGDGELEPKQPVEQSTLADEVAAEIELGLPQAAHRAVQRLGRLNEVASRLAGGGLVRKLPVDPFDSSHLEAVGVSTASATRPAFGGLLYGASALAYGLRMARTDVVDAWQVSRVQVGDTDFFGKDERIRWKQLLLVYEILEVLLQERRPQLILLDLPLFISRREEATVANDPMIAAEWAEIESHVNGFWQRNFNRVYPFEPHGAVLASLRTHSATSLFSALLKNPATSPDPLQEELVSFVRQNWALLGQLGQARLLDRVLVPSTRSCAYSYEDLDLDPRWQPQELHHVGILGLFLRAHHRTGVWHLQVPGHRTQWSPEALDGLGVNLVRATLFDSSRALPLPLWYARQFARFPEELLMAYQQRIEEELKSDERR
jgi:hypothetical protein